MSDYDTIDIDEVWKAPDTLLDPEHEPPPQQCPHCGKLHAWVWWGGRTTAHGLTVRARWTPPGIDPEKGCKSCWWQRERRAIDEETDRRQQIAGIAPTHRAYSWDRMEVQRAGETWVEFAWRVKSAPGTIGVCREDAAAAAAVQDWKPGHPGLFVCGPVGSGKSLWLSARLTSLLAPTSGSSLELSVDDLVRRGVPEARAQATVEAKANVYVTPGGIQRYEPLLIDEEEVVRRVELSWKGDQVPLLRIAKVQILAYDDIGTVLLAGGPKARELARVCLDRLIDLRWREGRPMLVTSNRTLDEICDAMNERTASRLRELCPTELTLRGIPADLVKNGFSWRRLPKRLKDGEVEYAHDRR